VIWAPLVAYLWAFDASLDWIHRLLCIRHWWNFYPIDQHWILDTLSRSLHLNHYWSSSICKTSFQILQCLLKRVLKHDFQNKTVLPIIISSKLAHSHLFELHPYSSLMKPASYPFILNKAELYFKNTPAHDSNSFQEISEQKLRF